MTYLNQRVEAGYFVPYIDKLGAWFKELKLFYQYSKYIPSY